MDYSRHILKNLKECRTAIALELAGGVFYLSYMIKKSMWQTFSSKKGLVTTDGDSNKILMRLQLWTQRIHFQNNFRVCIAR